MRYAAAMGEQTPYHEIVLEHKRNPRNFGSLPHCTHAADGVNALCGDRLRVEVDCRDGRIGAVRFSGESCAIAVASASMMTEAVVDRDAAAIADLAGRFGRLIAGESARDESLGAMNAFGELRNYASRRKCALLPWATLQAALKGQGSATTES